MLAALKMVNRRFNERETCWGNVAKMKRHVRQVETPGEKSHLAAGLYRGDIEYPRTVAGKS
jgi:hypothetical protein